MTTSYRSTFTANTTTLNNSSVTIATPSAAVPYEVNVMERYTTAATALGYTEPVDVSGNKVNAADATKIANFAAHVVNEALGSTNYAKVQKITVTVEMKG